MTSETGRRGRGRGTGNGMQEGAAAVAEQAGRTAEAQATGMMTRAGDTLDQVSRAVRQAGENLRGERPELANAADTAADRVHEASEYLRTHEVGEVMEAAQQYARRQPGLIVGGGLVLGFVLGRFLRAAQPQEDSGWQGGRQGFDRSATGYGGGYPGGYGAGSYGTGYGAGAGYGSQGGYAGAGQGGYGSGAGYGGGTGYGGGAGYGGYGSYAAGAAGAGAIGATGAAGMAGSDITDEGGVAAGARMDDTGLDATSRYAPSDLEASEDLGTTGGSELPADLDRDETTRER